MAAAGEPEPEPQPLSLELLPTDPLLLILSFLDYRDLLSCCCISRRLNQLSSHDPLWKRHCKKYWLLSENSSASYLRWIQGAIKLHERQETTHFE